MNENVRFGSVLDTITGKSWNPEYNVRRIVVMLDAGSGMGGIVEVQPVSQALNFPD